MSRAIAGFLLFWLISASTVIAYAAQEVYSQKERSEFTESLYGGCMEKQSRSDLNSQFLPAVVKDSCRCLADKMTNEVFGSMEFQMAMHRKDKDGLQLAISKNMAPDAVSKTFMACADDSIAKHGGLSKVVKNDPLTKLSTQIGLKGDSRNGYVVGGVMKCKTAQRQMPDNKGIADQVIESYCNCAAGYSADRISPADMAEILKQQPAGLKLQDKLAKESTTFCRQKVLGNR